MAKPILSQEYLKELFDYKDGHLYWKVANSNRLKVGQKAGAIAKDKRERISISKQLYLTHRLIYAYHHNYYPKFIDHIDGNNSNNSIENLRPTTVPQNQWNRKLDSRNTSGIKGVCWDKKRNKWTSYVKKHGKNVYLGRFNTIQEAEKAVKIGRITLHGEFARHK